MIGAHYRHTTPEMAARAVDAMQHRLAVVLGVAELAVERHPTGQCSECSDRPIHREHEKRERRAVLVIAAGGRP